MGWKSCTAVLAQRNKQPERFLCQGQCYTSMVILLLALEEDHPTTFPWIFLDSLTSSTVYHQHDEMSIETSLMCLKYVCKEKNPGENPTCIEYMMILKQETANSLGSHSL